MASEHQDSSFSFFSIH